MGVLHPIYETLDNHTSPIGLRKNHIYSQDVEYLYKAWEDKNSAEPSTLHQNQRVNGYILYLQEHSPQDLWKPAAGLESLLWKTPKLPLLQAIGPKLPLENRSSVP